MYLLQFLSGVFLILSTFISVYSATSATWFSLDLDSPRVIVERLEWGDLLESVRASRTSPNESDWRRALHKQILNRRPFVVENSPVVEWPALNKWKHTDYITQRLPKLERVRRGVHPVFVYEDSTRMLGKEQHVESGGSERRQGRRQPFLIHRSTTRFKYVNMSTENFLKKSSGLDGAIDGSTNFYYYSRRISESPSLFPLVSDAHPRSFLQFMNRGGRDRRMTSEGQDEHFWMGGRGVTASAHYDRDHNLFAQCVGQKRFVFWEPGVWPDMSVHPFYHPRDRQSQTVYIDHGEELTPMDRKGGKIDIEPYGYVDLKPGELLYIPPFWWHRVVSSTLSMSINVWTAAMESTMASTLNDLGLPKLVSKRSGKESVAATAFFLRGLVEALKKTPILDWDKITAPLKRHTHSRGTMTPLRFISSIIESRFVNMGLAERISAFECQVWEANRCPKTHAFEASDIAGINIYGEKIISHVLSSLTKILKKDRGGLHVHGLIGTVVGDYVERVGTFAVGPNRMCSFLRCVGHESGWKTMQLVDDNLEELRDGEL